MSVTRDCEAVRERIPGFVAGRLSATEAVNVEGHLAACADCAAEADLVGLLRMARPEPPERLAPRIREDTRLRPARGTRPWWGLAAAAVAAVALGIAVVADGHPGLGVDVPAFVAATEDMELWLGDDGLIAGAPALDGLSDEALIKLLEEMTSGGAT
jgi:anti-sigma factor RsiW